MSERPNGALERLCSPSPACPRWLVDLVVNGHLAKAKTYTKVFPRVRS